MTLPAAGATSFNGTKFQDSMLRMSDVSALVDPQPDASGTSGSGMRASQEVTFGDVFDIALLDDFGSGPSNKPVYAAKGMMIRLMWHFAFGLPFFSLILR